MTPLTRRQLAERLIGLIGRLEIQNSKLPVLDRKGRQRNNDDIAALRAAYRLVMATAEEVIAGVQG